MCGLPAKRIVRALAGLAAKCTVILMSGLYEYAAIDGLLASGS